MKRPVAYRGRLAPSPTGYLHLGHARTFWIAWERARRRRGALVLRTEDLDRSRCRGGFVETMVEDLKWLGLDWQEGPDCGGPCAPYTQSERLPLYAAAFDRLRAGGWIYPCRCSRQDVLRALEAPHAGEDEPIYPGTCRPRSGRDDDGAWSTGTDARPTAGPGPKPAAVNWRFLVPAGEEIAFHDGACGPQHFIAGRDFGDFVVWRADGLPAYQLACVVDDGAMRITEVVRGADLLRSTARQLLLYRALELTPPDFFHCPLMSDDRGVRLAKRHEALSLRTLRAQGADPATLRRGWEDRAQETGLAPSPVQAGAGPAAG